jgi:sigma-B regulation protein RsbU (phosphoserine phosphatase)
VKQRFAASVSIPEWPFKEALVRNAITLLIVGAVIVTIGAAAITVFVFRRRVRERFLLWFGLFSILYGISLVVWNSVFRLGFGQPQVIGLSVERLISLSTIVPGLLLFEEFYGPGWRSSIRWLIGSYCALAVVAMSRVAYQSSPELIPPAGTVLIIMVPVVLAVGRLAGYRPPLLPNSRVLFGGLLAFFCAFSLDRLRHTKLGASHSGIEPYGFLILAVCLGYVAAQRVLADEKRLVSLTDEMRAATRIQEAILPRTVPSLENLQIAVRYAPMTAVAGDLYDFPLVRPNCLGVLVADVMGHGVPAALVASMVKVGVLSQRGRDGDPASVMAGLNTMLCDEVREQYVTAVYLYLDAVNRIGRYAAAAHPPPLLWRRGGQVLEKLEETGLLLGVRPNELYAERDFSFEIGDRLLLYTDGLVEAENAAGQPFGEAALPTFIQERQGLGAEQFVDLLLNEVLAWSRHGTEPRQEDDITMLVIDIDGGATLNP